MSARSSDWRGAWNGDAVARRRPRPSRGGPSGSRLLPSAPSVHAGVDQCDEAPAGRLEVAADQVAVGHHRGGARVGQHVRHLGRGQAGVHGHRHPARPVRRGVGHEPAQGELGPEVDADAATGLEAGLEQAPGHGVGGAVPLGEGHGPDVDHLEGRAVTELGGHAGQVFVHQHGCGSPQVAGRCVKVDAGVRFVAAWPMRRPGVNPGGDHRICLPGGAGRRGTT